VIGLAYAALGILLLRVFELESRRTAVTRNDVTPDEGALS
jgi:hypothetical protein